jgi:hypothetical protein
MLEIRDAITGQFYCINKQAVSFFTKEKNAAGVNVYFIVLNNGIKIATIHKRWNKVRKQILT